jgi:hypothetical protein
MWPFVSEGAAYICAKILECNEVTDDTNHVLGITSPFS